MNSQFFRFKKRLKQSAIQTGLEAFAISSDLGFHKNAGGHGAIFTLHRVEPSIKKSFQPNAHLTITPEFLEHTIKTLKQRGFQALCLRDLPQHLATATPAHKVMCFTLDDGYLNNITHALPIFDKYKVPFTIFPCSGFIERTHFMWWDALELLIAQNENIEFNLPHAHMSLRTITPAQKYLAFELIGQHFIGQKQDAATQELDRLAQQHHIDINQLVDDLIMDRQDLKRIAEHPLANIGAHTVSHSILSQLSAQALRQEIAQSKAHLTQLLGAAPSCFAYPHGGRAHANIREFEAVNRSGFDLGVTTMPNVLQDEARTHLFQLPRISLNGYYQKANYVDALASGAIFKFLKAG